jgi:hypothetical protein
MKTSLKYGLIFILMVVAYACISYGLDVIFWKYVDKTKYRGIGNVIAHYIIYFVVLQGIGLIIYMVNFNLVTQHPFFQKGIYQLLLGLVLGALIGLMIHRGFISWYIGEYRPLKNLILYGLLGLLYAILKLTIKTSRKKKFDDQVLTS